MSRTDRFGIGVAGSVTLTPVARELIAAIEAVGAAMGECATDWHAGSEVHASLNRTCELGMTRATGSPYRHILQVLDDTLTEVPG